MAEDNERVGGGSIGRRTLLRSASFAAGAVLLSGHARGTGRRRPHARGIGGQSLYTGVHTASDSLTGQPLVVYRRPESDERTICATSVSWRHRVVVPPGPDGEDDAIYTDLYAVERFPAGTVMRLVDRLSACPDAEGTLIFVRRVASPDGE